MPLYKSCVGFLREHMQPIVTLKAGNAFQCYNCCYADDRDDAKVLGEIFRTTPERKYNELYAAIFDSIKRDKDISWGPSGEENSVDDHFAHYLTTMQLLKAGFCVRKQHLGYRDHFIFGPGHFAQLVSVDLVKTSTLKSIQFWWDGDKWALDWRMGGLFDPLAYVEQQEMKLEELKHDENGKIVDICYINRKFTRVALEVDPMTPDELKEHIVKIKMLACQKCEEWEAKEKAEVQAERMTMTIDKRLRSLGFVRRVFVSCGGTGHGRILHCYFGAINVLKATIVRSYGQGTPATTSWVTTLFWLSFLICESYERSLFLLVILVVVAVKRYMIVRFESFCLEIDSQFIIVTHACRACSDINRKDILPRLCVLDLTCV